MVKKLTILLIFSILMVSCTDSNVPDWFSNQGVNITECGPTVAANAINWAGGDSDRYKTRSLFTSPAWWTLTHIYSTVSRSGVHVEYKHKLDVNVIKKDNVSAIFYVNRTHFINVDYVDGKWMSYDPLYGIKETTSEKLLSQSWVNFIAVYK